MRVAFHSDSFARKRRYGLARYAHQLRSALVEIGVEVTPFSSISDFPDAQPEWLRSSGFVKIPASRKLLAPLWSTVGVPRCEWLLPAFDILHSVDVDYPAATSRPWVVTFHDLGPLVEPQYFTESVQWLLKTLISKAAARADAIICVSASTASEFEGIAKSPVGDRISIIHEGVSNLGARGTVSTAELATSHGLVIKGPYFLCAGSISPRKNMARILSAFSAIGSSTPHKLVVTGDFGWGPPELRETINEARASGKAVFLGHVDDAVLQSLIAGASGFLYPSLYEGFGLPILEAMALGCPVITSDVSAMPEVAGDAALLIDPTNVHELAAAMQSLATDADLSDVLRQRGLKRAATFTWENAALQTARIYGQITTGI